MSDTMDITLDCGCTVEVRQEWEYGCAGDCHPGQYVWNSGYIRGTCSAHNEAHAERVSELEDTIGELEDDVATTEARVEELEGERDEVEDELRQADITIAQLRAQVDELRLLTAAQASALTHLEVQVEP